MNRRLFTRFALLGTLLTPFVTRRSNASVENAFLYDAKPPSQPGPKKISYEKGEITLANGEKKTTYATFNEGYSHIVMDDHCWRIVNGKNGEAQSTPYIFPEAAVALKGLPANPHDCTL